MTTAKAVMQALRVKYPPPAYGILTEVGDATGAAHRRWADALIMSLWPSRGLELIGIEIKVRRQDWLTELANPAKAEAICKYCDRWYLVVGDASIIKPGELPPTWGLITPHGDGLRVQTEAPVLTPEPLGRGFLAAIFRRSIEQGKAKEELDEAYESGYQAATKSHDDTYAAGRRAGEANLAELVKKIRQFEEASGIRLSGHHWTSPTDIGLAYKLALNLLSSSNLVNNLKTAAMTATRVANDFSKHVDALEALTPDVRTLSDSGLPSGSADPSPLPHP